MSIDKDKIMAELEETKRGFVLWKTAVLVVCFGMIIVGIALLIETHKYIVISVGALFLFALYLLGRKFSRGSKIHSERYLL